MVFPWCGYGVLRCDLWVLVCRLFLEAKMAQDRERERKDNEER
jgi:hypothetical protein